MYKLPGQSIFYLGMMFLLIPYLACQSVKPKEVAAYESSIPEIVDFNFHVKPILSDRCFKCHGPDAHQRKGDLRLDVPEDAYKQSTNLTSSARYIIDPGNLKGSELAHRILSHDADYMMPTPESNLTLDDREKAILLRWIEQGATYKLHWSFSPPQPPTIPEVRNQSWTQNNIDHFILKQLESQGLEPSGEASGEVVLRRIALDLTGLPPTLEEQRRFLQDDRLLKIEDVIDFYQAKPQYGERMALEWMDVARYADSHGYQDDGMRNTWPYRDWVIEHFNQNMPYDTFLLWQLAGDLLPSPTDEQLLATCFNRNHPQTQEGGVVDEEYRVEYVADRTNTLGKGILGLTLECARCHDHKYDPITQSDYYALSAFFNNNNDAGIVPYNGEASPTIILPDSAAKSKLDELNKSIALLEDSLTVTDQFRSDFNRWWQSNSGTAINQVSQWSGLMADFSFEKEVKIAKYAIHLDKGPKPKPGLNEKPSTTYAYYNTRKSQLDAQVWGHPDDRPQIDDDGYHGYGIKFNGDAGIRFNRDLDFDRDHAFAVSLWVKFLKKGEEGPIFGKTNGDFEGYRGWLCKLNIDGTLSFQLNHVWPDNCIDFQTLEPVEIDEWTHLVMSYDGSSKADGVKFYINGRIPPYKLHRDHLKKSLLHGVRGSNWSNQPFLLGMELRKSIQYMVADELKVFDRNLSELEIQFLFAENLEGKDQEDAWFMYYLLSGKNPNYNRLKTKLQQLRCEENLLMTDQPEVMVMHEKKFPRTTYVLNRGAYDAPGDSVEPGIPYVFQQEENWAGSNRLSLANWVISDKNPLTARVQVNRLWKICFGKGLVSTQEDFGNQGSLPSHPELLDYLALRFIEMDWDMKALLKEIMLSATYRQSSKAGKDAEELDPENHYYSHYPAHRLSAEMIRDQALAASGLLVKDIGGPSVYPYQPDGIWEALATRNATKYQQQTGDSLYRRSLYTVWKRSSPPPAMLNFDAPDRYYCVVSRQKTSTPLQSLVLMNDPQFVEAARVLGEQMMRTTDISEAVQFAFRTLFGRGPRPEELDNIKELWQALYQSFSQEASRSTEILRIGDSKTDPGLDQDTLTAYAMVASTLMNYDEFVVKR